MRAGKQRRREVGRERCGVAPSHATAGACAMR